MIKKILLILPFILLTQLAIGQSNDTLTLDSLPLKEDTINGNIYTYEIINGDTIPILKLREFQHKDPDFAKQWRRAVYFTRRVYPYAVIIDSIIDKHEAQIAIYKTQKKSKRKIRKHNKKLRKTLSKEYGLEIKNMSVTRGKYLAKLVHYKSDQTIYQLIKKYKSGTNAFLWHMVMKIYGGANLKAKYEPDGDDWMLALVIKKIEEGTIQPIPRHIQRRLLLRQLLKEKQKK